MQMILNTKVSLWIRNKTECLVGILYVSCTRSTLIDVSSQVTPSILQAFLVITTSIHKCKSFYWTLYYFGLVFSRECAVYKYNINFN